MTTTALPELCHGEENRRKNQNSKQIQGSRIRFVLGCVIPRAGAVARSRNLGQALFGSPVLRGAIEKKQQRQEEEEEESYSKSRHV